MTGGRAGMDTDPGFCCSNRRASMCARWLGLVLVLGVMVPAPQAARAADDPHHAHAATLLTTYFVSNRAKDEEGVRRALEGLMAHLLHPFDLRRWAAGVLGGEPELPDVIERRDPVRTLASLARLWPKADKPDPKRQAKRDALLVDLRPQVCRQPLRRPIAGGLRGIAGHVM